MATARFLSSEPLWQAIGHHVRNAKTAHVAVAYFGSHGAKLLPLRRGHKLVVDMSLGAVRQVPISPDSPQEFGNGNHNLSMLLHFGRTGLAVREYRGERKIEAHFELRQ